MVIPESSIRRVRKEPPNLSRTYCCRVRTVRCPLITCISLPKGIPSYTRSRLILTWWKPFPFLHSCDLRLVYIQDARVSAHATTSFVMMAVALTSRWLATEWSSVLMGLMKLSVKIVSHLYHVWG